LPIGLSPGQNRSAIARLMTIACADASGRSVASKKRPATSGMRMTSKYPASATR
jgi:hypothetical protein